MKHILIVEDDITLNKLLTNIMQTENYNVSSVYTVSEAKYCLGLNKYDLAILDINLPDGTGYEICKIIKETYHTAIIFLTANDLETDMVKGYELGASDYITKPFPNSVIRHKVNAIFSLLESSENSNVHNIYDDVLLKIDFSSMHTTLANKEIIFAPLEYRMLEILVKNKGLLLTRQKLLEKLWDNRGNFVDEHTLTATISRIRKKIDIDNCRYIKTVYGMGYMFVPGGSK